MPIPPPLVAHAPAATIDELESMSLRLADEVVRLRMQASSQKDELAAGKTRTAAQTREIAALREELARMREKLGEAETRLSVEAMHAEGLRAQGLYLVSLGTEAPRASEPSGQHYADGEVKTRLAVVYEEAFDRKGHEMGISDPTQFRAD
ncbi:Hypothetical protein HVPorG_03459 [Roseomonas mucosa]|uniref:Uncharacterized protein n=3 Tax=Roseomonas mucosa TaxID=207340 RepID=A0A379MXK3_9PROT|nr:MULTISPECIES: hypothetical protein [Roseomonas]MBS5903013.1 hypothetical protein [Acetobacteraceae bacterium]MCG7352090.1 hypothetical protein [Roseomonas mucosa]MDT8276945.1 hypothetical protein [Roseomonas mucosa]MDT8290192.1 hypothetical protein [Roseomonas mucosa]MDT8294739.1 hypothetical protein [Roseomonas mucosa]